VLEIERIDEPRGLRLVGELDLSNVDQLNAALEPEVQRGGEIALDVAGLSFIGSAGVQALIRALLDLEGRGGIVLVAPGDSLRQLIGIMGLDRFPNLEVRP
jgi:anti-anti-sigma factor